MKKVLFTLSACLAICILILSSCQKEAFTPSHPAADVAVIDRDVILQPPPNPCALAPVHYSGLAVGKPIVSTAFGANWKWGTLDTYANDCVLRNAVPGNCEGGGTAVFSDLLPFQISNFVDANGYVSVSNQQLIVNMAIAYAQANISCGAGTSPTIYRIDFTRFQSGLYNGEEIQFAVRYVCCPSGVSGNE